MFVALQMKKLDILIESRQYLRLPNKTIVICQYYDCLVKRTNHKFSVPSSGRLANLP